MASSGIAIQHADVAIQDLEASAVRLFMTGLNLFAT